MGNEMIEGRYWGGGRKGGAEYVGVKRNCGSICGRSAGRG